MSYSFATVGATDTLALQTALLLYDALNRFLSAFLTLLGSLH